MRKLLVVNEISIAICLYWDITLQFSFHIINYTVIIKWFIYLCDLFETILRFYIFLFIFYWYVLCLTWWLKSYIDHNYKILKLCCTRLSFQIDTCTTFQTLWIHTTIYFIRDARHTSSLCCNNFEAVTKSSSVKMFI